MSGYIPLSRRTLHNRRCGMCEHTVVHTKYFLHVVFIIKEVC